MEQLDGVNLLEVQTSRQLLPRSGRDYWSASTRHLKVIVLRDGKAVWNASHYDVNATAVNKALEANS
jgi:hypothetical protein